MFSFHTPNNSFLSNWLGKQDQSIVNSVGCRCKSHSLNVFPGATSLVPICNESMLKSINQRPLFRYCEEIQQCNALRDYIVDTDYTALNVMRGHSQSLYEVRLW